MQHAVDRNGCPFSEKITTSKASRHAAPKGALGIVIFSIILPTVAIDDVLWLFASDSTPADLLCIQSSGASSIGS
jgi:hypothetical protein